MPLLKEAHSPPLTGEGVSSTVASANSNFFLDYNEAHLPVFKDRGRDRFLIPASLTHGFLLEMVE